MIVIIDYGMGNLRSVENAFKKFSKDFIISNNLEDIKNAEKIVLPGVGAFGDAMENLSKLNLIEAIKDHIQSGKYFLGICLGLQLLFNSSEESKNIAGLGIIDGEVLKFSNEMSVDNRMLKVPQIGWNSVELKKQSKILDSNFNNKYFYFVHSYYVKPEDSSIILTTTDYGITYCSSIEKDNIFAFQFHPEKSHNDGLSIIKRFVEL